MMPAFRLNTNPDRAKSRYFHKNRTQPFIITFFMAVLAFKKIFKIMRLRLGQKRQALPSRRASVFLSAVKKSGKTIGSAMQGRAVILTAAKEESIKPQSIRTGDTLSVVSTKKQGRSKYQRAEIVNNQVTKVLDSYYTRLRNQTRQVTLADRLDQVARNSPFFNVPNDRGASRDKRSQGRGANAKDPTALLQQQLTQANMDVGEYLEGTPIYYGATLALQARHGGYLSYSSGEIKASAHKVTSHSRFVVKKSDDLTDVGAVKYGDALWLQTVPSAFSTVSSAVLGAVYGSLVDKKREIQPGLVSCKRSAMFKAQQYGRWIVLHRDDPVGTLGRSVGHLDRVILEQEWCFLASNSPYSSSMYRICQNSDDALARKIDLFRPGDECVWRFHLVALPSDDGDDEKQRQQRLQEAKDQIDASEALRLKKAPSLLSSLASSLADELRDEAFVSAHLGYKNSAATEQEHLRRIYEDLERRDFQPREQRLSLLKSIYGAHSGIVSFKAQTQRLQRQATLPVTHPAHTRRDPRISALETDGGSETLTRAQSLERSYWEQAQRLLLDTRIWTQLSVVMGEFKDKDRARKQCAALVIQQFARRTLDRRFNFLRSFRRIDCVARTKLEAKLLLRRRLLLDANGGDLRALEDTMAGPPADSGVSVQQSQSAINASASIADSIAEGGTAGSVSQAPEDEAAAAEGTDALVRSVVKRFQEAGALRHQRLASQSDPSPQRRRSASPHRAPQQTPQRRSTLEQSLQRRSALEQSPQRRRSSAEPGATASTTTAAATPQQTQQTQQTPQPQHQLVAQYAAQYEAFQRHRNLEIIRRRASVTALLSEDADKYVAELSKQLQHAYEERVVEIHNAHKAAQPPAQPIRTLAEIDAATFVTARALPSPSLADPAHPAAEAPPGHSLHRLLNTPVRPHTAPSKVEVASQRSASQQQTQRAISDVRASLGQSQQRPHGLPADVLEDIKGPTSLKTGVKFLQAMSQSQSSSAIFDDLRARKKPPRPQSSNAALRHHRRR